MPGLQVSDAAAVAERFGVAAPDPTLRPVARGAVGRIWKLSAGSTHHAVKELFWQPPDERAVRLERELRGAAGARGVASALDIRAPDGRYVASIRGIPIRMYSWVVGRRVRRDESGRADWLGRALGVLHGLQLGAEGVSADPWYDRVAGADRWTELAETAHRARADWADALHAAQADLADLGALVRPVDPALLVRCHRDLTPSNVLVDPTDGRYVLLDWDNVGPAQPDRELAAALHAWHVAGGVIDRPGVRRSIAAYHRAGGRPRILTAESVGQLLAARLNYLEAQAELALSADQPPEQRGFAEAAVRGVLADLPAPWLLDRLLDIGRDAGG